MEETIEEIPEPVEPEEPVAPEPPAGPAPKRRGRPPGAKDRAPRKIKIVSEPIAEPVPEPIVEPVQEPTPEPTQASAPPPMEVPAPPSPRTLHRQAAELTLHLNNQRNEARRTNLRDMYTKNLAIF